MNKFKKSIEVFGGIQEGVFGKSQKEKNSQRAVLNILHRIDGMVGDAKRGKMTEEQLGKIMVTMHKDIVDARIMIRQFNESVLSEADGGPVFTRAEAAQIEKIAKKNHAGNVDKSHPSIFEISVDGYTYEINKDGYRKEPDKAFFTVTVTGYDSGRTNDLYRGTDFNKAIKALDKALY